MRINTLNYPLASSNTFIYPLLPPGFTACLIEGKRDLSLIGKLHSVNYLYGEDIYGINASVVNCMCSFEEFQKGMSFLETDAVAFDFKQVCGS